MKLAALILVGVGTVGLIATFVYMRWKLDQLERKIVELEGAMAREKDSTGLGPETLRKIREIYGLASEDREPANQEPQA